VFVILVPSIWTLILAFFKWDGIGTPVFVGIKNFSVVFSDSRFLQALSHNIIWTIIFLTIPVAMGLGVAELLRRTRWQFAQTFYFLPVTLPVVVIALIWRYLYNPIRGLGKFIGVGLLGNFSTALYAIAFANIWAWWGFLCVVFYSAIQGIPKSLYEAAVLDGANKWQEFWHVTLPQIVPTVVFMEIMSIIWSFQVFDWIWVTTQGGPAGATELLATLLYKRAFFSYRIGEASVIGLVIAMFGCLAVGILFYLRRKGVEV
jgi:raffinose/stachyose/melibiose transport system permease protein